LTFTVAIDPQAHGLAVADEPKLALATAVAIVKALDRLQLGTPSLGIRWPNDLEAGGRKLGGVLPERVETARGRRIQVGVGLNVFTQFDEAPAEVANMATSLAALHGMTWSEGFLADLLAAILSEFERALSHLVRADPALAAEWSRLDLLRDRHVQIDLGSRVVEGRCRGIDGQGALCLVDAAGQLVQVFGGTVLRAERS
jgi:BirA family biotin operon repressor/biotin-[acetyl-CoA-carboxylase] ligase